MRAFSAALLRVWLEEVMLAFRGGEEWEDSDSVRRTEGFSVSWAVAIMEKVVETKVSWFPGCGWLREIIIVVIGVWGLR